LWAGQFLTQIVVERNEAEQHQQAFEWGEFFPQFWQSTFENWRMEAKLDRLLEERGIDPVR
jgi:hypothetical protein